MQNKGTRTHTQVHTHPLDRRMPLEMLSPVSAPLTTPQVPVHCLHFSLPSSQTRCDQAVTTPTPPKPLLSVTQ